MRLLRPPWTVLAMALALLGSASAANADVYIVVNSANPTTQLTQKQVVDLFMGRSRQFEGAGVAAPLDLPRGSSSREDFYRSLTGWSEAQVNSYWARLQFSGQVAPPPTVADERAMVAALQRDPRAIGYLFEAPTQPGLRTVLVLKDPAR